MKIHLAAPLTTESIVDGPGLRTVIWCQGCPHDCPGCQNPQTHDEIGGFWLETADLIEQVLAVPLQSGVTFSGGEPMLQPEACLTVAKALKQQGMNLWCYTGFLFEDLCQKADCLAFLQELDVLVDGIFIEAQKSYDLTFRGSANQRLIDVKESLATGQTILYEA